MTAHGSLEIKSGPAALVAVNLLIEPDLRPVFSSSTVRHLDFLILFDFLVPEFPLFHVLQCSSFAKFLFFRPRFAGEVFHCLGLLVYVLERIYIRFVFHDAHPDRILRRWGVPTLCCRRRYLCRDGQDGV